MQLRLCALATLSLAGCANDSGNTDVACSPLVAAAAQPPSGWTGTVFTIVMENKNRTDIIGNVKAPYINLLASDFAVAGGYHDSFVHPSEPNYLWMVAGENFGILDDDDPASHPINSTSHLADQIENAGLTWRAYEESMGDPCGLTSHGRYAAKHDPFVFFEDIDGWDGSAFQPSQRCTDHVVDYSQFDVDLAANALPNFVFITPNLDDDMHDGTIEQGDTWAASEVPKILASPQYQHGGVLFLLWDEGSGDVNPGDDPPFLAISPNAKQGFTSWTDYGTSSFLLTVEKILGVGALPCAGSDAPASSVPIMDDLFTMPMGS